MIEIDEVQKETGISIDPERIPRHIAIIMDGNGRWATGRNLPRVLGHSQGYQTAREIVRACGRLGVDAVTLYAFSTENWRRPREETDAIMELIEHALRREFPVFMESGVRLMVSGRRSELSGSLQGVLEESIAATSGNAGLILNLAVNYGGRQEILDAVCETVRRVQSGGLDLDDVTEESFSGLLYTAGLPDPDLLIRTAGELRVSNFLLWQMAYAEIWVTPTLWPDFTQKDLMQAISDFQGRTRKFGAVPNVSG